MQATYEPYEYGSTSSFDLSSVSEVSDSPLGTCLSWDCKVKVDNRPWNHYGDIASAKVRPDNRPYVPYWKNRPLIPLEYANAANGMIQDGQKVTLSKHTKIGSGRGYLSQSSILDPEEIGRAHV